MDIETLVKSELHKIHRSRNRIGYLPTVISLLLSLYFQRSELLFDARWWIVIVLISAGTVIRICVNEFLYRLWEQDVLWVRLINWLGFLCISLSWGLHFSDVYHHYGGLSSNVVYTFLVLVALLTGASTINVGDKVAYHIYVLLMTSVVCYTYLSDSNQPHTYVVINIVIYLAFSMANYRMSSKQLCDLLEAKIRSQTEKDNLKKIIDTVPGFVGLIDRNLVCYMANQSTVNAFPNIIGSKMGELNGGSSWEKFIIDFMATPKRNDVEEHHTIVNGKELSALVNITKMDDGGAIIVSIITTELVRAEKKLREQEAKAYYSSKLASLGEMAAGIAHEVNNPLTIIQGSANILKKVVEVQPLDIQMVKELTTKMITTSERISKTVKSLKALSRNGVNDPVEPVSLTKVIDQCLDVSQQKCRNTEIAVEFDRPAEDVFVMGREVELAQVFLNLILNSVDAVKGLDEKWVKLEISKNEKFAEVSVVDSGPGIPPEIQDKIMNPFFTTKDVNQGTGLGLSISKNIITSYGGELTLLPDANHTTFKIRLPLGAENP